MQYRDEPWPFLPSHERTDERVWAVRPLGGNVQLRYATYSQAAEYSHGLLARGVRNIWVYPEDEVLAVIQLRKQYSELFT